MNDRGVPGGPSDGPVDGPTDETAGQVDHTDDSTGHTDDSTGHTDGPADQTILVTGGAGFIGSRLAASLAPDNDVRVLDNLTTGMRSAVPDDVTFIEGDVRDATTLEAATEDVDCIFHQAALVSVARSTEVPRESHSINATATLELLERARDIDARVVLASSAAIYGTPESIPIDESASKTPASPYGLDKLATDHYARLYHELYGLETVALRYFNAYGPGQQPGDYAGVISIFVDRALDGEPIVIEGDGEQTRDFVSVDDVVRANRLAATTDAVGEAYNVATGRAISIRELAELVQELTRELTDTESEIVHDDPRPGDIRHSTGSIEKARTDLGYEPAVDFRTGLERTIEWMHAQRG